MFDFNTIDNFDEHISQSIPSYPFLIDTVKAITEYFVEDNTNVYDLGCSTGNLLKSFQNHSNVQYVGIDNSSLIPESTDKITFINNDLCDVPLENASIISSMFTLQFLNRIKRKQIFENIKNGINKGGAVIICEKVYATTPKVQDILTSVYYEYKEKHFDVTSILKKERELRENMRIVSYDELLTECSQIGTCEIFWKFLNFVGILITV